VVVENDQSTSVIVATNYAIAIDAHLLVVRPLEKEEESEAENLIIDWRNGVAAAYGELEAMVNERIGQQNLNQFLFATFFTTGLPYSLILKNGIPCSYVHLHTGPDRFIMANLLLPRKPSCHSAVLFSPGDFKKDEIDEIEAILRQGNYFVKKFKNKEATVRNLDRAIQNYPYSIFHICSHGGEVTGDKFTMDFTDQKGQSHTVEFDEVRGFLPIPGTDKVEVQLKHFPRIMDGEKWRSEALKAKGYDHHVFTDMYTAMQDKTQKRVLKETQVRVHNSTAVICSDFYFQGMVRVLSSDESPFIYNNSCWSWNRMGKFFLEAGAVGYIGTLWAIGNDIAINCSIEFYKHLLSGPIIDAFHRSIQQANGSPYENIYIFWGLHFSILPQGAGVEESRAEAYQALEAFKAIWERRVGRVKDGDNKTLYMDILKWLDGQITSDFNGSDFKQLWEKFMGAQKKQ